MGTSSKAGYDSRINCATSTVLSGIYSVLSSVHIRYRRDSNYLSISLAHFNITHGDLLPNPVVPGVIPFLLVQPLGRIVTSPHEIEQNRRAQPTREPDREIPPGFEHGFLLPGSVDERFETFLEFMLHERVET